MGLGVARFAFGCGLGEDVGLLEGFLGFRLGFRRGFDPAHGDPGAHDEQLGVGGFQGESLQDAGLADPLAILGLAATTAAAQEAPARAGFWGGFGMGWGSMGVGCGGCGGAERLGSYSGYLKLGGTLTPAGAVKG